jgi:hypothetical protein
MFEDERVASLHVDHSEQTGLVRALLCGGCNTGLGQFQESPTNLRRAADYLELHAFLGLVRSICLQKVLLGIPLQAVQEPLKPIQAL